MVKVSGMNMIAKTKNPIVSVIIPLYNCEKYVGNAIESILTQTYGNYEIIVVNDGSTDGSKAALAPYWNRIVYLEQENRGSASARNKGIQTAVGELIAFLDADDCWMADKLALQVPVFLRHPEIGLVYADRTIFQSDGHGSIVEKCRSSKRCNGNILDELFRYNFIGTQTVIVRANYLAEVGLFDESLRAAQDYDLWLRICEKYNAAYLDKVVSSYRIHKNQISWKFELSYQSEKRVIEKFLTKHPEIGSRMKNRRFSDIHFRWGHDDFAAKNMKKAQDNFLIALQYHPSNLRALFYFILSFFPPYFLARFKPLIQLFRIRDSL